MSLKSINAPWNARSAKRSLPRDGVGLGAVGRRQRMARLCALAGEAVDLFLDIDERWLHNGTTVNPHTQQSKLEHSDRRSFDRRAQTIKDLALYLYLRV